MRLALTLASLCLIAAAPDDGPVRTLTVVNDTSTPVNQLFVRGDKHGLRGKVGRLLRGDDETDRLGAQSLRRGGAITVQLSGDRCAYDLTAVLEDGRTFIAPAFDICVNAHWSISTGTLS